MTDEATSRTYEHIRNHGRMPSDEAVERAKVEAIDTVAIAIEALADAVVEQNALLVEQNRQLEHIENAIDRGE